MSDCTQETLVIRDREGMRQLCPADAWTTTTVVGALSADPRSFDELARAWLRYQSEVALQDLPWEECHELHNRERQWSNEGRCPRPLDRDTFAYRYGPLGRHEVVMYFDLCREVLGAAWKRIVAEPEIGEDALSSALHEHAQWWLAEGSLDGDPTPPAAIIEEERRRKPLVRTEGPIDPDCPLCRMEAEGVFGSGPTFCTFDGHHLELDDEFAFSLCATREEWEKEQEDYRRFSEEMEAKRREREEAGEDPLASVWKTSYVNEQALREAGALSPRSVMALAMRVAELIGDLKAIDGGRDLIESLNNAFDAYCAADDDRSLSAAAAARLAEALEQIAATHPPLTPKAADLQSQLAERQRQTELDFPF